MDLCRLQRILAYAVLALGAGLAFASAVVPHFSAGYRLLPGVLLSGLLPYLVYGLALPLLRGALITASGAALAAMHAALVVAERFGGPVDYSDGLIHFGPWLLAVAMLPLLVLGLRRPWGAEPPPTAD